MAVAKPQTSFDQRHQGRPRGHKQPRSEKHDAGRPCRSGRTRSRRAGRIQNFGHSLGYAVSSGFATPSLSPAATLGRQGPSQAFDGRFPQALAYRATKSSASASTTGAWTGKSRNSDRSPRAPRLTAAVATPRSQHTAAGCLAKGTQQLQSRPLGLHPEVSATSDGFPRHPTNSDECADKSTCNKDAR